MKTVCHLTVILFLLALTSCGTRTNTPYSRQWQAFTTRYNVFHNGDRHFREQLEAMEKNYLDDYSRFLPIHPAEALGDETLPQPSSDFRLTVEKMQKAIELHSISRKPKKRSRNQADRDFRAREEFNPFLHNAWMRMGEALYYDGDFETAAATFLYVSRHFKWLPDIVTEARLLQAQSYCALGWLHEAENTMRLVRLKNLTSNHLQNLYNLVEANLLIRSKRFADAAVPLSAAADGAKGMQRRRLLFLLGQLYQRIGNKQKAFEAFGKAAYGPGAPKSLKIAARIRQSEVYSGNDIASEIKALAAMTRYESNADYLDLIYYAMGNLRLTKADTAGAEKDFKKALSVSTRENTDAALAKLALGNLYFDRQRYELAQPLISEAVAALPHDLPDYREIETRSRVLDELALYSNNISLQDSLLSLASLPQKQKEEICRKLADSYRKQLQQQKDDEEKERRMANETVEPSPTLLSSNDNSWYFYNRAMVENGKTDFQKKWGVRKLEDNWRRRNKSTFSFEDQADEAANEDEEKSEAEKSDNSDSSVSDPTKMEHYLASIPSTPAEIAAANRIIEESLYNMGVILKDRLDNYPAARKTFLKLDSRYPDNPFRIEVYNDMFLMAVREGNKSESEIWRKRILSDFPSSPYAKAVADPEYFNRLRNMNEVQSAMYEKAYAAYLDNRNQEVLEIAGEMERLYPLSPMMPKFMFLDALASLSEGNAGNFREGIAEIVRKWPDSDVAEVAGGMLKRLQGGAVPVEGGSNPHGILWETTLGNPSAETQSDTVPVFLFNPEGMHYLVIVFNRSKVNPNQVVYDIARFNFTTFSVKDFDLELMGFGNVGLLVVKSFGNVGEACKYLTLIEKTSEVLPESVNPVVISKEDFETLLRESRSFEEYFMQRDDFTSNSIEEKTTGK